MEGVQLRGIFRRQIGGVKPGDGHGIQHPTKTADVIPVEMRRMLDLADRDTVEIAVDGDRIVLQKHTPRCVFCSRSEALVEYHNRRVCASCMRELSAMGGGTKVARRRTED